MTPLVAVVSSVGVVVGLVGGFAGLAALSRVTQRRADRQWDNLYRKAGPR